MNDAAFKGGNRGAIGDAISTIDVALWDLKARLNDEPLWRTLGASKPRVRAYASGLDLSLSDDELTAFFTRMAKQGVQGGKLKLGVDLESDEHRLGLMRDALATSGKRPELMIDSNEYWSPKQAIRHISHLEESFDITWAEEPARRWDYRGLRQD
jgi:L-alanine-DL-glutamate epimerase-like enolase superfamily enzyme